jgi:hypothetical protein
MAAALARGLDGPDTRACRGDLRHSLQAASNTSAAGCGTGPIKGGKISDGGGQSMARGRVVGFDSTDLFDDVDHPNDGGTKIAISPPLCLGWRDGPPCRELSFVRDTISSLQQ